MKLPLASKSVTRSITIAIIWVANSMIVLACFPWKFSADHTRLGSMVSETVDFRLLHLDARQASHQIYINSAWQNRRSLRNGTQRLHGYPLCFWGSQRSLKTGQQTDLGSHLYPQDPCMDYGTFIYMSWVFMVNVGQYASFMAQYGLGYSNSSFSSSSEITQVKGKTFSRPVRSWAWPTLEQSHNLPTFARTSTETDHCQQNPTDIQTYLLRWTVFDWYVVGLQIPRKVLGCLGKSDSISKWLKQILSDL